MFIFSLNGYRYHKRTTILKKRVHVPTVKMIKINFGIQLPVWVVQNCPYSPVSPAPIPIMIRSQAIGWHGNISLLLTPQTRLGTGIAEDPLA